MEQKKKIKIVIIVLAVLFGLSLVALGYTLVRNKPANNDPATVRAGYEKLAEVLQVRVKLLTTGETLYDGLVRDMPASVTHKLASANSTTALNRENIENN